MKLDRWVGTVIPLTIAALFVSACGASGEEPTPTLSFEEIQTQAVATYSAELTATAQNQPTETPTATATETTEPTRTPSGSPTAAAGGTPATGSCYGLRYVSDVTVPDDSDMNPGQTFTKTWRVRNSGACPWQEGFTLRFTGGESMGGSPVSLEEAVQPGAEIEISVELTAPSSPGTYRGNWRMTNAGGTFFGDEIYVLIEVTGSAASPTPDADAEPTATATTEPTAMETEGGDS